VGALQENARTANVIFVMKKQCNIVVIFLSFCLLTACNKENSSTETCCMLSVPMEDDHIFISPDTIYASVKYIPLETTDESVFYEIDRLQYVDSIFYVMDGKQCAILMFDNEGKFLKKLIRKGPGPEEYLSIEDLFIADSQIYVLSSASQKILIYDLDFKYIRSIEIGAFASNITFVDSTIFVYCNFCSFDYKNLYVIDKLSGKMINKYRSYLKKQAGVSHTSSVFSRNKNELYAFFPFDYAIYKLDENGEDKYLNIDFGEKYVFPPSFLSMSDDERKDYIKNSFSDMYSLPINNIDHLHFSDNLLFFTFLYHTFRYYLFIDRKFNIMRVGTFISTEKFPFADLSVLTVWNDQIIGYVSPEAIYSTIEHTESTHTQLDIPYDVFRKINITDNPVLCIYSLK
jgi:hypothetical protein